MCIHGKHMSKTELWFSIFFLNLQVRILILTELFRKLIELKNIDHWLTMLTVSTLSPMTKLLPNVDRCELIQQLRKSLSR